MSSRVSFAFTVMLLAAPVYGDVVKVPGDFATLQQALDAVEPGTTIQVRGGTWGPLVITKPVTILGRPAPLIEGGGDGPRYESPITLAGPGSGSVTLARVEIGGSFNFPFLGGSAGISGGGFDELRLIDAEIRGPQLTLSLDQDHGESAVDTTVPLLLAERCTLRASRPIMFDCADSGPDGVAAVQSPGTVVLLDSRVQGGGGVVFFILFGVCGVSPCPDGGDGGPGVVCDRLFEAGSVIVGGAGALWAECDSGKVCCQKPNGESVQATTQVSLGSGLVGSGSMVLGQPLTLTWMTPGPLATLYVAAGPMPPLYLPGLGYLLIDSATLVPLGVFAAPGQQTYRLPLDSDLVGLTIGLQLLDATEGLTRPVFGTLLP